MADLEDLGYIFQPHTSAGRIPSDKGYRFYVDLLMENKEQEISRREDALLEKTDKVKRYSSRQQRFLLRTPIMRRWFPHRSTAGTH